MVAAPTSAPTASASVDVAASAETVYDLITDLDTLAELADETTAMTWRTGTRAEPGAVFRGANRNGWRRWSTTCTVTDADPGRTFAFEVHHGLPPAPVARWQYDIVADGTGCTVTESTWDRRPGWFKVPAQLVTGITDRTGANADHIAATLRRLKARAEATA